MTHGPSNYLTRKNRNQTVRVSRERLAAEGLIGQGPRAKGWRVLPRHPTEMLNPPTPPDGNLALAFLIRFTLTLADLSVCSYTFSSCEYILVVRIRL